MADDLLPGGGRAPLVSEVYDRLAREWPAQARNRSALFQIALQVCTEELRLTKRGNPPASMDILVERAKLILTGATRPPADLPPLSPGEMPHLSGDPLDPPFDGGGTLPLHPGSDGPFVGELEPSSGPTVPALTFEEILARQEQLEAEDLAVRQATRRRPSPLLVGALVAAAFLAIAAVGLFLMPRGTRPSGVDRVVASAPPAEPAVEGVPTAAPVEPTAAFLEPTPFPQPTMTPQPDPPRPPTPSMPRTHSPARPTAETSDLPEPVPARPPAPRRVASMTSIDWRGKDPAYVIHFSSYRDRAPAMADARRLEAEHVHPAFAVVVDLGPEGRWWRVILAGFPDAEAAFAYRNELIARHTPELGHVFRIESP